MSDAKMRELVDNVPVPDLEGTPLTVPPPLRRATVAIVTTAALRRPEDPAFGHDDVSFRALPSGARELTVGHASPNWDRSGIAADLNVAYPADRLEELAAEGIIGAVAPSHLSFHGIIDGSFSTLMLDTGPAAAHRLRDEGVDVVLLTPV